MKRFRIYLFLALALAAISAAHIYEITRGVHFKGGVVDFGEPPRREAMYYYNSMEDFPVWRPGTVYYNADYGDEADAAHQKKGENDVKEMQLLGRKEANGKLEEALLGFRSMTKKGCGDASYLHEQIELIQLAEEHSDPRSLTEYLNGKNVDATWIQPYARYDQVTREKAGAERSKALVKLATDFPHSPRAEPALITAARDLLGFQDGVKNPPSIDDQNEATRILQLLLSRYPKTRFRSNAIGWLGRVDFLQDRFDAAINKYREQLAITPKGEEAVKAIESIILCEEGAGRSFGAAFARCQLINVTTDPMLRGYAFASLGSDLDGFSASDAKAFWAKLKASPEALSAYLDYRIGFSKVSSDLLSLTSNAQVAGSFAPHIYARLGEAAYRLHNLGKCEEFANRCLASDPATADRALATFLLASIAQRKGNDLRAMALYERVVDRYPSAYVAQGARENLALLYERSGRLGEALDNYYALGYSYDVAYMLDMRMSPEQIARYLRDHPNHPSRTAIRFSLGIRYLRQHRFDEAEATLAAIPAWKRKAFLTYLPNWTMDDEHGGVVDPLKTTRQLKALYSRASSARGVESRARALLAVGNYYYEHRNLLLYNPRLWRGDRAVAIGFSWNTRAARPEDDKALAQHHQEHECMAQALVAFDEVVKRYPRSKAAQRAAYRGACAAWRLSNFSPYWRWVSDTGTLRKHAVNLMARAAEGNDKSLGKAAAKFSHVFADDLSERQGEYKKDLPPRRWNPNF